MKKTLFGVVGLLAGMAPVQAQLNWTGTSSTDWFSGSNWNPAVAPTAALTVNINSSTTPFAPVVAGASGSSSTLSIGTNVGQSGQLTIGPTGSLTVGGGYFVVGDNGTGSLIVNGGTLTTNTYTNIGNWGTATGTATVTGSTSLWTINSINAFVGDSGTGTLAIENGGRVSSVFGLVLGNDSTAVGQINVSGSGSRLTVGFFGLTIGSFEGSRGSVNVSGTGAALVAGPITISTSGTGSLVVQGGATGTATSFTVGSGKLGTALFDGQGTTFAASSNTLVGLSATGSLTVQNGAVFQASNAQLGQNAGSSGIAVVTGSGARWDVATSLNVGHASGGTGSLSILNGGTVTALNVAGRNSAPFLVSGTGSLLHVTNAFVSGSFGMNNRLSVLDGASFSGSTVNLTTTATSGIATIVSGTGSTWNTGSVTMGGSGSSSLVFTDGAVGDVVGEFIVDGSTDTKLTISNGAHVSQTPTAAGSGQFRLGVDGYGELLIENGGILEIMPHPTFGTFTFFARNGDSTAKAVVTGSGSQFITHGSFIIGNSGDATLDILDGATVNGYDGATVGSNPGSVATVRVSGTGSSWNLFEPPPLSGVGSISLGAGGDGTLLITDGAIVNAPGVGVGSSYIDFLGSGTQIAGTAFLLVSGSATRLNLNVSAFQTFDAGGDGATGTIQILDGAQVTVVGSGALADSTTYSGVNPRQLFGYGEMDVDGQNSVVTYTETLDVGARGVGVLNITNGGSVSNSDAYVGSYASSGSIPYAGSGTVSVSGLNSHWENNGTLRIGDQGHGWLNITDSGTVSNTNAIMAASANATGTAFVSGTGSAWVTTGSLGVGGSGIASLTVADGGTVSSTGPVSINGRSIVNIGAGGVAGRLIAPSLVNSGTLRFDHTDVATFATAVSGTGTLVKINTGTSILTGTSTYTGATSVNAGALLVNGEVAGSAAVASAAVLGGGGRIGGAVTIANGGILTPFNGTGSAVLQVGGLTLNDTSLLDYYLGAPGAASNSRIDVDDDLHLNGLLRITNTGGFSEGTYRLMNYGGTLTDAGLTIQSLPMGFNPGNFAIDVATTGEVNLIVPPGGPGYQYWDGTNVVANGMIDGGSGVWTNTATNWTNAAGNINGPWAAQTAVFTRRSGVVVLGSDIAFTGLIFEADGFQIVSPGYALQPVGDVAIQVVGGAVATIGVPLVGPGVISKTDFGTLILNGSLPSSAGGFLVQQGGLIVNTVLNSPTLTVFQNALLGGSGVINGNVFNNGFVSPGNSPGTLTINGNYTQSSSGTLQIEFGDLLWVSGRASLAGTLQYLGGTKLEYGQQITFLQAGTISGDFDQILMPDSDRFRGRFLTDGGTGILLVAPTSYTLVAETTNQRNVAKALDSYITATGNDRETVSIALDLQSEEQYPYAFDQIAPTFYESLGNITIEQAFAQTQQLNQRLSAVRLGVRGFQAIGIESPLVNDKDGKSVMEAKDAKSVVQSATSTNWNIWAMGNGMFGKITNVSQVPNYDFNSGGFLVGADYRWSENFTTGVYTGYQYTWADYGSAGNTQINSALFGGYATYDNEGFYADAVVGGGYNGYRVRRSIKFSNIDRTARSTPNGGQLNAAVNLGYDWEIGKFTLGPIAGVQYTYAGVAPFTEDGAESLDLRVNQQNVNSIRSTLGARIAYTWNVTEKIAIIPEIRMLWTHEFLNNPRNISSALDGGAGPTFGFETSAPARDSCFAGAGLSVQLGRNWNAFAYYNIDFGRQDYLGNYVSGGLTWKF